MSKKILGPAPRPCASCPYRCDVPSGVWAPEEYAKLPAYDAPTQNQPPGVFLCHQANGRVCAGWLGCHDQQHLLALRLATLSSDMTADDLQAAHEYESPVPLWGSGYEAAQHGLMSVQHPSPDAQRIMRKILRGRS